MHGDAVENPMEFTYDELLQLPRRQAIRYFECFGNGRTLNWEQLGYDVQGGNWGFGDVSQGEWEYIPIAEILDRVKPRAGSEAAPVLERRSTVPIPAGRCRWRTCWPGRR